MVNPADTSIAAKFAENTRYTEAAALLNSCSIMTSGACSTALPAQKY